MSFEIIDAEEVLDFERQYDEAASSREREEVRAKLDDLANSRRFRGGWLSGNSGASSDEAAGALNRFGARGTYEYMYGEDD